MGRKKKRMKLAIRKERRLATMAPAATPVLEAGPVVEEVAAPPKKTVEAKTPVKKVVKKKAVLKSVVKKTTKPAKKD